MQVVEIDNLGTFLLRAKAAPELVDKPRSFFVRIKTAEEEKQRCDRIWSGMTQAQRDDRRDPRRQSVNSEYEKFVGDIKQFRNEGKAEFMKFQKEVDKIAKAAKEV